jgi:hypothetical protein
VKLPPSTLSRGRLKSQTFDSILTITDKLTRLVRLGPGGKDWSANEWAEAYFSEVYPTLRVPVVPLLRIAGPFSSHTSGPRCLKC